MKICIISVGKKSNDDISRLCQVYEKRLKGRCDIRWQLIEPAVGKMTQKQRREQESLQILNRIEDKNYIVLLDERGVMKSSVEIADFIKDWRETGKQITFIIGGAFGVSDKLQQRANLTLSLSKLVFPHEIVRLVLIEQIYRAYSINEGLPYHHE